MSTGKTPYKKISQVIYIGDRLLFPISWFQKQDFCEYQIYLENIKGIRAAPTPAMAKGKEEHDRLYSEFAEKAIPVTLDQMLSESRTARLLSRELRVADVIHGLYGYIDEVWLRPDSFVVIDDKPGIRAYTSNVNQVFGYCLAFKVLVASDERQITAALRERGTENIFWQSPFDEAAEEAIISISSRIHNLLSGKDEFNPCGNPNKCRSCRLRLLCDKACSL
jgi:CRISPR-associated exonuclease Cas4